MPSAAWLARTTMTAAFQRMKARIRRSMYSSPGNHGSWSGGMVLTYGVETVAGKPTWFSRARSSSFISRKRARVLPWVSRTASKESTHSAVSSGIDVGELMREPVEDHPSMLALVASIPARGMLEHGSTADDRLHRRRVPGESGSRRMGVGRPRRPLLQRRRPGHDQSAHGDPRRPPGRDVARRPARGRQRLDLRRQLLPRPLVGGMGGPGLGQLGQEAGGQPRSLGAADRRLPGRRPDGSRSVG